MPPPRFDGAELVVTAEVCGAGGAAGAGGAGGTSGTDVAGSGVGTTPLNNC